MEFLKVTKMQSMGNHYPHEVLVAISNIGEIFIENQWSTDGNDAFAIKLHLNTRSDSNWKYIYKTFETFDQAINGLNRLYYVLNSGCKPVDEEPPCSDVTTHSRQPILIGPSVCDSDNEPAPNESTPIDDYEDPNEYDADIDLAPTQKPRKPTRHKSTIAWIVNNEKHVYKLLSKGISKWQVSKALLGSPDRLNKMMLFDDEFTRNCKAAIAKWRNSQMKMVEQTDGI